MLYNLEFILVIKTNQRNFFMKKLMLLIPLMLLSSIKNVDAMRNHGKSMKKMHTRRGSKSRRMNQPRRGKRVVQRQRGHSKKKVDLTGCLSALKQTFSPKSLVSKASSCFSKNGLATKVLLCMIFYLFLGSQQANCLDWKGLGGNKDQAYCAMIVHCSDGDHVCSCLGPKIKDNPPRLPSSRDPWERPRPPRDPWERPRPPRFPEFPRNPGYVPMVPM